MVLKRGATELMPGIKQGEGQALSIPLISVNKLTLFL